MASDQIAPEIRALIGASGAPTYSAMAEEIAAVFGAERVPPVELIAAARMELRPPKAGYASRYERDSDVMAFVADRAGLVTLDEIVRLGVSQFGAGRFPSRSQVHRLVLKARMRAAEARARAAAG